MTKDVSTPLAVDPFTGEEFVPRTPNHYEANDGVPVAKPVSTPRLSLRERVERLLVGGADLTQGIYDDDDPSDWEDEDGEPLTDAERAYVTAEETVENIRSRRAEAEAAANAPKAPGKPASPLKKGAATPPADPPAEGLGADSSADAEQ